MSEHEPNFESGKHYEQVVDHEHYKQVEKVIHEQAEQARQKKAHESLEKLEALAKEEAEAADRTRLEQQQEAKPEDAFAGMQHVLKTRAYDQTMANIRQKLPKPARLFSQFSHNKTVDKVSNLSAKTIARPSGILGGSICAFLGSLTVLYYSKHYGFRYNYALFVFLFIGGFLVGATIELAIWTWHRKKHGRY